MDIILIILPLFEGRRGLVGSSDRRQKVFGRDDRCLHGKYLLDQATMDFGVAIRAAVLEDDAAIVRVGGMPEGGEDHAAGGDSEQHERVNLLRAKDHVQVGAGEGAHAVLDDGDVSVLRGYRCMHL